MSLKDKQLLSKFNLFIEGHRQLIEFFHKSMQLNARKGAPDYIVPTDIFEMVLDRKVDIADNNTQHCIVQEWRPLQNLIPVKAPDYFTKYDEYYTSYKPTLNYRKTPAQLIVEFYKNLDKDLSLCFNEFSHTLKYFQKQDVTRLQALWENCNGFPHWNACGLCTKNIFEPENVQQHLIFITLLWRVHNACFYANALNKHVLEAEQKIEAMEKDSSDYKSLEKCIKEYWETIYNLRAFRNTHIKLAQYICDTSKITDRDLRSAYSDDSEHTAINRFYPDDVNFFGEEHLIDLTKEYSYVNFIADNNDKKCTLFYLLEKLMPKRCQSRKLVIKQIEACKDNDAYANWVKLCLMVSMMGMYRTCRNWLDFNNSIIVHKWFHLMIASKNIRDDEIKNKYINEFTDFQLKNSEIVINALKEHMFFQISYNTAFLNEIKKRFRNWTNFEASIRERTDIVRYYHNKQGNLDGINDFINESYANVRFVYTKNPASFIPGIIENFKLINNEILQEMDRRAKKKNSSKNKKNNAQKNDAENINDNIFCNNLYEHNDSISALLASPQQIKIMDKLPRYHIDLIDDFVSRQSPVEDFVLTDMSAIGVSQEGINMMIAVHIKFFYKEQNKILINIMKSLKYFDYKIIDYLFQRLAIQYSLVVIPTDYSVQRKQMTGLATKYDINQYFETKDATLIPDTAMAIVFTNCCRSIKTFTVQDNGIKCSGQIKTTHDSISGGYMCYEKKSKNNSKKRKKDKTDARVSTLILGSDTKLHKEKKTKIKQDKNINTKKCKETRIIPIRGVGNVVQFDGSGEKSCPVSYTICHNPLCGSVTEFNLSMIGPNGFTCNVCDKEERIEYTRTSCNGQCKSIKKETNSKWNTYELFDDQEFIYKRYNFCGSCMRGTRISNVGDCTYSYKQLLTLLGKQIYTPIKIEKELYKAWYFNVENSNKNRIKNKK